jgi:hypothetical protein
MPATKPSNGLPDCLVRHAEALGNHAVAEAELAEVEGLRRDPLIHGPLLGVHQSHLEGEGTRSSKSLRPGPLKEARAEKIGPGSFVSCGLTFERRESDPRGPRSGTHSGGEPRSRRAYAASVCLPRSGGRPRADVTPAASTVAMSSSVGPDAVDNRNLSGGADALEDLARPTALARRPVPPENSFRARQRFPSKDPSLFDPTTGTRVAHPWLPCARVPDAQAARTLSGAVRLALRTTSGEPQDRDGAAYPPQGGFPATAWHLRLSYAVAAPPGTSLKKD